ncbi:glycine cleavage system H protein [Aphelenchoides avenae]|nr:glycine cleavage system H protein [Aphelenchus avenae]
MTTLAFTGAVTRCLRLAVRPSTVSLLSRQALSTTHSLHDSGRLYTKKHEWISVNGDEGTVGISHFAQESLGDVVYVELPEVGLALEKGETAGAIESVKAASDVYAPVSGAVTERNTEVESKPHLINKSTYDKGWLFKLQLKNKDELKELMDEAAYEKFRNQEEEESA